MIMRAKTLWKCPGCGRAFANRNQSHSCGPLELEHHFAGTSPEFRALFDLVVKEIRKHGPVKNLPVKTRIAFQTRMSFAQLTTRKSWLVGHFVLAQRIENALFNKIETISRRNHVHHFRLNTPEDIGDTFRKFLAEAYAVGNQEHLISLDAR